MGAPQSIAFFWNAGFSLSGLRLFPLNKIDIVVKPAWFEIRM